jgi:hypothetical protein
MVGVAQGSWSGLSLLQQYRITTRRVKVAAALPADAKIRYMTKCITGLT